MRPNILLTTLDQWRADHLGASTHALAYTPHLDALARQSTVSDRHYCQAYPCGPARASLLTGQYAHRHGVVNNGMPLDARHPVVFTELRRAGYRPTLFGYTDLVEDPVAAAGGPTDAGAGLSVGALLTDSARPWLDDLRRKGYDLPRTLAGRHAVLDRRRFDAPALYAARDSEAAFLTDRFLDWLPSGHGGPFCAHLSFIAPHPPFVAPAPFHWMFAPDALAAPLRGATPDVEARQHPLVRALHETLGVRNYAPGLSGLASAQDAETIRRVRAIYAGQVRQVDDELGRIFAALRQAGQWERTVIVVTADHSEQLFDHWLLGKTAYFDQSAHIPLLVRDPRPAADGGRGRHVQAFTESVDIMPTLPALAGVDTPAHCDGHSLVP
jgi:arylsulfatase A-like enzyme